MYVLVLLSSAVTQFFDPANALMALSSFGSTAIGLAGLIASRFPIEGGFYLNMLSFAVSAACIALVRIAPIAMDEVTNVTSVLHNLRAGVRFLIASVIDTAQYR